MPDKVLLVDDDRILLFRTQKQSAVFKDRFQLLLAENGRQAVEKLEAETVALVVTDLQMPVMDGFELLSFMSLNYPDIPVIIITAYGTLKSRRNVLQNGAVEFIEKPIEPEALTRKIYANLDEIAEEDAFQSVPLELFSYLIVSEKKTCTLRVVNRNTGMKGVLFFSRGVLMDARLGNRHGREAASEMYAWHRTKYTIQDLCAVAEKKIPGGLQDVLPDLR